MKKSLLFAAAILIAASGNAQVLRSQMETVKQLPVNHNLKYDKAEKKAGPRQSATTGVYYIAPEGGYWLCFDPITDMGYGHSYICVPAYTPVTLTNMSSGKGFIWTIKGKTASADNIVDGNYVVDGIPTGYIAYVPTVWNENKTDSFCLTDNSVYHQRLDPKYEVQVSPCDTILSMTPVDDHAAYWYQGTAYGPAATWGFLDSDNMFGTGADEEEGVTYTSYGVEQVFSKPISPLYITNIFCKGNSFSTSPIPSGTTLTATIYNVEEVTYSDGSTGKAAGDQVLATFTATIDDIVGFTDDADHKDTRNGKTIYEGNVIFSNRVTDSMGNVSEEPVVIDQEFAIVITGFDQQGVDLGVYGYRITPEEATSPYVSGGALLLSDPSGKSVSWGYSTPIAAQVGIMGMYDFVKVDPSANAIRISDDGTTNTNDTYPGGVYLDEEQTKIIQGAIVTTGCPWYDATTGDENYYFDELPEWITGYAIDDQYYKQYGIYVITFQAEPISSANNAHKAAGGRKATLKLMGRGMEAKIQVLQGDAVNAIEKVTEESASKNNAMYNIAGQRVNNNYKGIVIQNGKKFINK